MPNRQDVEALFGRLSEGDSAAFFERVDDNVDWTVEGTHPLAGHYQTKAAFRSATFERLAAVLPGGPRLSVENVLVDGDHAVVELSSSATAQNGMAFNNRYCWVCRFEGDTIVAVRAYLDSWLVGELFRQNPD